MNSWWRMRYVYSLKVSPHKTSIDYNRRVTAQWRSWKGIITLLKSSKWSSSVTRQPDNHVPSATVQWQEHHSCDILYSDIQPEHIMKKHRTTQIEVYSIKLLVCNPWKYPGHKGKNRQKLSQIEGDERDMQPVDWRG